MEPTADEQRQEREQLAGLLMHYGLEVEQRWLASITPHLKHHGLPEPELRDSVPDYIQALAAALRREGPVSMEERGGEEWAHIARQHAVIRVRHGFDVGEVLREFMVLRRVISEVLRSHTQLSLNAHQTIVDLIDGALGVAVRTYVDSRDYQSRSQHAQHIGFITHELRNPLTTATAAAGQLRKLGATLPALGKPLDLIERSLRRLRELIDQTLLTQRLEAQEVECHPAQLTLGDLFDEAFSGARDTAMRKGIAFHVHFDPEIVLDVDRDLAVSAVQNIVDNAAKFTDHGQVDVTVEDTREDVVIHVRDECNGLSPEELSTIFEPFKRGHQGKSGTGLGLAIARRAIEAHGKTIQAESREEAGCHFWFALPKAKH
jgi:signal transduction histidine kinase